MATDMRIRVTKQIIRDSFLKLLEGYPLNKITVTQICREAEINRVTFYKYYQDVFDLYEKTVDELIEESSGSLLEAGTVRGLKAAITHVLTEIYEHIDRYRVLFSGQIDAYHQSKGFAQCISKIASLRMPGLTIPEEEQTWLRTFLSCGGGGVLAVWVNSGMQQPPEVIAERLYQYIRQVLALYDCTV